MDYQKGESNFKALVYDVTKAAERNEAATRLHFIDKFLEDCMGWPTNQIDPERHHEGEYSDYELGLPARKVVVEAKREGEYFELPAGVGKKTVLLQSLFKGSETIAKAVSKRSDIAKTGVFL